MEPKDRIADTVIFALIPCVGSIDYLIEAINLAKALIIPITIIATGRADRTIRPAMHTTAQKKVALYNIISKLAIKIWYLIHTRFHTI